MMMKVDFASSRNIGRRSRGLFVTLLVNWLVKPFSMAAFAWLFFRYVFASWIPASDADQYIAGCIILAARPWCSSGATCPMVIRRTPSSKCR